MPIAPGGGKTINGTSNNDVLNGSSGDDVINGFDGSDTIHGGDGNDVISGGNGQDFLYGDAGDDTIYTGTGSMFAEFVFDGDGNDTVYGAADQQIIYGSAGNDYYDGGTGATTGFDLDVVTYANAAAGIVVNMNLSSGQVRSSGSGDAAAIGVDTLVNIEGIRGSNFNDVMTGHGISLDGGAGDDLLTGDNLVGGAGNDTFDGSGVICQVSFAGSLGGVTVSLGQTGPQDTGEGLDTFISIEDLIGSSHDDTLIGDDGDNYINGLQGNDILIGGGGNDHLVILFNGGSLSGGSGDDTLEGSEEEDTLDGGTGHDVLWLGQDSYQDLAVFHAGDGADDVWEFGSADVIKISGYAEAQSVTQVGFNVLIQLSDTDQMTIHNQTVATVEAAIQFNPATEGDDVLTGTSGNDTIDGLGGNDTIEGLGSDDFLVGGAGSDSIDGGDGNDFILSDALKGSGGLNQGTGADNGIEHDILAGGAGDDDIVAGYCDSVDGGDGTDTLYLSFGGASSGVSFDTSAIASGTSIGGGTIQNVEQIYLLFGSDFADNLTIDANSPLITVSGGGGNDTITDNGQNSDVDGGAGDDTIYANGSDSVISGGTGNDQIFVSNHNVTFVEGDEGNDTISLYVSASVDAGDGDDTIFSLGYGSVIRCGEGIDTVDYSLATIGVRANLSEPYGLSSDQLFSVEKVVGSGFADTLTGDSSANVLDGRAGNDIITGGTGNDSLTGGEGADTFLFAAGDGQDVITDVALGDVVGFTGIYSAQSVSQVGADVVVVLSGSDKITFQNTDVATVQAGLQFDDAPPPVTLTGTSAANVLIGGAGNDTLNGLGGNDKLDGGAGADTMNGGAGNDIFYVDNAGDVVTELSGQGADIVHSTVSYTLGANIENGVLDGSSSVDLTGNALANSLTGNDGDNFLYGMAGSDKLIGGAGNDTLRGGLGADTLTGGLGSDKFLFEAGGGNDKVTDFVSGTDKIDLHLLAGVTSADLRITTGKSGTVISVDANHDGKADFTITLTGVTHVDTGDFIFA